MTRQAKHARFARFSLGRTLGRGATAAVLAARDEETGEDVVLRFPHDTRETDPDRAVRLSQCISSLHVVRTREVVRESYRWAWVCDLVRGSTVLDLLGAKSTLAQRRALALVLLHDVSVGLTAMHEARDDDRLLGLVHGDISPGNVMLTPSGTCVILDLGGSRRLGLSALSGATFGGTAGFVAPEVIRGMAPSVRSDVFSVGALTLAAWTGRSEFDAGNELATFERTVTHTPAVPANDAMSDLVTACLAKRAERRPESARAVAEHAAAIVRKEPTDAATLRAVAASLLEKA